MLNTEKSKIIEKSFKAVGAWFEDYTAVHLNDDNILNDKLDTLGYLKNHPNETYPQLLYNDKLKTAFALTKLAFNDEDRVGLIEPDGFYGLIVKDLKTNYGYINMSPTTLTGVIDNVIKTNGLRFNAFPRFEEQYFIKTDNPLLASKFFTPKRISLFETLGNVKLIINRNTLLARIEDINNHSDWLHLLNLAGHLE